MTTHQDLDRLITEALSEKEAELYADLGEPSLIQLVLQLFQTRNRWLVIISMVATLAFTIFGTYCAVQFFQAEETNDLIRWGAYFFFSMISVIANKIWCWTEMQRNVLTREIKRLELQVAHLGERIHPESRSA